MTSDEMKAVKLAWANGETVQYKSLETDGWTDWASESTICVTPKDFWRVKPKPIVIYVWGTMGRGGASIATHSREIRAVAESDWLADMRLGAKCTPIVEVELERPEE